MMSLLSWVIGELMSARTLTLNPRPTRARAGAASDNWTAGAPAVVGFPCAEAA